MEFIIFEAVITIGYPFDLVYRQSIFFSYRPKYPSVMGLKLSFQPVANIETTHLLLLPEEILIIKLLPFLDISTLLRSIPTVCSLFYRHYGKYMVTRYPSPGHKNFLYEQLLFSGGGPISQPAPEVRPQLRYFRPKVNLSFKEIKKPDELRIDVFTTSISKEINWSEVSSVVMKLPTSDGTSVHVRRAASKFSEKLLKTRLKNLKNLKVSGAWEHGSLFTSLSKQSGLNCLYMTCPSSHYPARYDCSSLSGLRRLHLDLEENFSLLDFPLIPALLEEFSIHFSNLRNKKFFSSYFDGLRFVGDFGLIDSCRLMDECVFIDHCTNLKKM